MRKIELVVEDDIIIFFFFFLTHERSETTKWTLSREKEIINIIPCNPPPPSPKSSFSSWEYSVTWPPSSMVNASRMNP
jgi:hypothetical protein